MDSVSTGCERLDTLMGGGVPTNRSLLVTGPPATAKTTLAMQFLQEGIDDGEACLLVSTEQTLDELRDTVEPYPFDVDAPELTIVTVNAAPGATIEDDHDLVVRTLDGGERAVTEWFDLPFTRENVVQYLAEYAPKDRVVLDSVAGLRPITEDRVAFWRSSYHLIRLFTDEFGATSILTAQPEEDNSELASGLVSYATHAVVSLDWEQVNGQRHRTLRVSKLRGRRQDDRRHKLVLDEDGASVRPVSRSHAPALLDHEHLSTGYPGLDELLGGGLVRGGLTTITHDGRTGYYTLVSRLLARALDEGMTLSLTLPAEMTLDQLDRYWAETDWSVGDLLDADRLVVNQLVGPREREHRNVLALADSGRDWEDLMRESYERRGSDPVFALVDTEPLLQTISETAVREVRYEAAASETGNEDVVCYTANPRIIDEELTGFLVDTSSQTLDFYRDDDGLEWVTVEKSPTGEPGSSRLVAYQNDPPYVEFV
jgi:KaiC/GvpD/RAD55 family RecA-like ATPase